MDISDQGYIINPWKKEKINKEFIPIIQDVLDALIWTFADRIHSIYVRGSVSSWDAVYGHSDLDMVCILHDDVTDVDMIWDKKQCIMLEKKYPQISFVDITLISQQNLLYGHDFNMLRVNMTSQSCLLHGKDIRDELPLLKSWPEMAVYLYQNIGSYLRELYTYILNPQKKFFYLGRQRDLKIICRRIMRTILRSSLWLVMLKKAVYSPNVKVCFKEFTDMYPDFTKDMEQVLEWEYYPIRDRKKINAFLHQFLPVYIAHYEAALQKAWISTY